MIDRLVHKTRAASKGLLIANRCRRLAARWGSPAPCIYDWSIWGVTLIHNIAPRARRIRANVEESPQELADRLPSSARTLLLHLDITDNTPFIADPAEFVRIMAQRDIRVLNAHVNDIRKSTVQSRCASYGLSTVTATSTGDPDELLFVKTDLNTGGTREQRLTATQKAKFNLPASIGRLKGRTGYHVSRRADLSADIWNDPELVVQRFIENPQSRFFRIYSMVNAVVISEAYTQGPIKRMGGDIRRYNHWFWRKGDNLELTSGCTAKLPPALLHTAGVFINRFQLEYGAMDVVESAAGEFFVIDVNKTPFWDDEHQPGLLAHLRSGFQKAGMMV